MSSGADEVEVVEHAQKLREALRRVQAAAGARDRALRVEQLIIQPKLIAEALRNREWELLAEVADTIKAGIPADLAQTDPARFQLWMKGLTYCYLIGWHRLNSRVLRELSLRDAAASATPVEP